MMKTIKIILFLLLGAALVSCEKPSQDPVLDMSLTVAPVITSPQDGSSLILSKDKADSVIIITWTAAEYNLTDLSSTNYSLEMDSATGDFSDPVVIASSTGLSYETTVGAVNVKLQNVFGVEAGATSEFKFRVRAFINNSSSYSEIYSQSSTVGFTTYSDVIVMPPIYMLGSATAAGWDNTKAIEMTYLEGGKYGVAATLTAGASNQLKFISDLGAWAPQWGTDATGTGSGGPLIYRPTEDVPDPAAIPAPAETAEYYIIADTANLTYSITLGGGLSKPPIYMLGSATEAGWNNANALEMTYVSGGKFSIVATLTTGASNYVKFISDLGAWAPQWGTDASGTWEGGPLVYRPTEDVPDPPAIPAPSTTGEYLIEADTATLTYTITAR